MARFMSPFRPKRAEPATALALLEFQSPTEAVIERPIPLAGRAVIWTIAAAVSSVALITGVYPVDRVVSVSGKTVANVPNVAVQPLDTSVVRAIDVKEGQLVHAGDLLVRLDPTAAGADLTASESQVTSLQAEIDRLTAESENRPYLSDGSPPSALQSMIYAERHAERTAKLDSYQQKIDAAKAKLAQARADVAAYAEEYTAAATKEQMRRNLERLQVGSKLNTLDAGAQRAESYRTLQSAVAGSTGAQSDLDALIAERDVYLRQSQSETAQELATQGRKLAEARDQLNKARLHHGLVDLRADRDEVVLNVSKISVGSVVQSGDELMTLVPADAPLSVEASMPAREAGFAAVGDKTIVKFDTLPYTIYGYAQGTLTRISADSFAEPARQRPHQPDAARTEAPGTPTYYRSSIALGTSKLHNLPAGFRMMPGMPVTADIEVGRRTILSYLLSRVVPALTEGMREP
ncbi:MAG: HlyD family type I secretion periplasmic adaptor subunit [Acetobacteraceae bacterium]|nr:HlyD family type I secretion periplasmic adaptor subunit [Acetobacteraceae bacterium]